MIQELDIVVLTRAVEAYGLEQGDVGTVVHTYAGEAAFEVEFASAGGGVIALLTLGVAEVRPIGNSEIFRVRELRTGDP